MLNRKQVIQSLLSLYDNPSYLEIGVNTGKTFLSVAASYKVGVDPVFRFDRSNIDLSYSNIVLHEVESDVFFGSIVDINQKFHVIFLDGLHTFSQTLRDFNNATDYLHDNGVIVIDDVIPNFYHASLSDHKKCISLRKHFKIDDRSWMGDVYKLVFFIKSFFQQYSLATTYENHGQAIVWKNRRAKSNLPPLSVEEISTLPFEKTIFDRMIYNILPLDEILNLLKQDVL